MTYILSLFSYFPFKKCPVHKFKETKLSVHFISSRSRRKMQSVSNISITGMLIMYLLAALFGYLTFYGRSLCQSHSLCASPG